MNIRRVPARWFLLSACLGIAIPLLAVSRPASGTLPATGSAHGEVEMNISGNGDSTNVGEPEIAIDPLDNSEMFVDAATFSKNPFAAPAVQDTCQGWSSLDGGRSWQPAPLPPGICDEDGIAVFGPDGTLYAGGDTSTSTTVVPCSTPGAIHFGGVCILVEGQDPVMVSRDGGHSWSAPVYTMGSTNLTPNGAPFPFVPGSGNPLNTFDRPWLAMDQSTNTLYAIGHNIADHEGFVTASTDEARSFGPIHAIDSPSYPQGGLFGGTIAAAHGTLAVAYTATSAPGATCPCVIFETSTDHGATFTRHVVPTVNASSQPFPFVTVDPTARGHFALTVFDRTGTENQVYTTDDFGAHWQGPSVVVETPSNPQACPVGGCRLFKPWISYGPSGQLLLVWRTWEGTPGTAPYDVWLAAGRDEGHGTAVFGTPLRVSTEAAAYPAGYTAGDDFSWVTADREYIYVGWGDSRNAGVSASLSFAGKTVNETIDEGGGVQLFMARLPQRSVG